MRELQYDLTAVFGAPIMAHAQWAVVVRSLDSGESLFELNANKLMMPASNMKIVTLAAAAHVLGWDHRFATTLETNAPVLNGALAGDLIVRGGGDPTINNRNSRNSAVLDEWAAALKAAGIERVDGRIIGDDDAFDDEGLGGGWAWDYLQFGYAAPSGALQFNENVATLTVNPGLEPGDPANVSLGRGAGLTVVNRAVTAAAGSSETIQFRRFLDRPVLEVTGSIPLPPTPAPGAPLPPTPALARQVAVVNPTQFFAQAVKDGLIARGIAIGGDSVDIDDVSVVTAEEGERRVLVSTESPPLREIAKVLMKVSQNQYAETLLKAVAAGYGVPVTVQSGRAVILRTLREWQVDENALILADGSGLSRYNYVTAAMLADILERMYSDTAHREPFLASLPVAGKDGTIAARMRRTRAEGNVLAKTGSIANVRALSGYVRTRDGEMLAFSILANDFNIPAGTVNWIADLGVEVLSNFTRKPASR